MHTDMDFVYSPKHRTPSRAGSTSSLPLNYKNLDKEKKKNIFSCGATIEENCLNDEGLGDNDTRKKINKLLFCKFL